MQSTSVTVAAAGQAVAGGCKVYGVTFLASGVGAGTIEVRDGGVAGTIRCYLGAPTSNASHTVFHGLHFDTDVWITGANIAGVTVEYIPDT